VQTGRDVVAWVDGKASGIGVVEVEVAEGGSVGKRRQLVRRSVPMMVALPPTAKATSRQMPTGLSSKAPIPHPITSMTCVLTRSTVAASMSS